MNQDNKSNLKIFFIKLVAITFAIIVVINVTYNLIFADRQYDYQQWYNSLYFYYRRPI